MDAWSLTKQTVSEWNEDKAPQLGAALAFYSLLSMAPLLVIALSIAGAVWGEDAARGGIVSQFRSLVGHEGAEAVEEMIVNAQKPQSGRIAAVLGMMTLLFGASGVFGSLQDSLNTIWDVKPKEGRGILGLVQDRFFSFAMVLGTGFLLLASLIISAALAAIGEYSVTLLPQLEAVLWLVNLVVSLVVITLLFALILKFVPDVKVPWRSIWPGAILTAGLFTVGKFALGWYLGREGVASAYGAAGSLVVLILWVYYSAQILFFGAEFTQVYARSEGDYVAPKRHASWEPASPRNAMPLAG